MKLKALTLSIKVAPVAGSWTICTWEWYIQWWSETVTAPTPTHSLQEWPKGLNSGTETNSYPARGVWGAQTPTLEGQTTGY